MEKLPTNTSEAIRFSGGLSKLIRNIEEELSVISQGVARAGDLISFYENELDKIARTKILSLEACELITDAAKQAIKQGKKM